MSVNDSVLVWELNVNNISDKYDDVSFVTDIIGPYWAGKYATTFYPNSINGKCMKWWINTVQDFDAATFGCVAVLQILFFDPFA